MRTGREAVRIMTTQRNDEVKNMMAVASTMDAGEPWQAVETALEALPPAQRSTFMDSLHAALVAQGRDPNEDL